jgi:aspartyl-tRNA(Asn)/glutamyl-tRNA(Gln) amidotransferase subunit B
MDSGYEMVIGLETHVELATETKIFCGCSTAYGAPPNTQCCPGCLGMPGALPVLNARAVELAAMAGLALNCSIAKNSVLERKHYFYPDLTKAYQISQFKAPLCTGGHLDIGVGGEPARIGITRVHIEEDAGKLMHAPEGTLIDYNRCGMPLIEIVSEPDMRSAAQAVAYLKKLRAILKNAGVSQCRMNRGEMRCDVNLSVRRAGETELGTRAEIKNLNSFQFAAKAIEYEAKRQIEAIKNGEAIVQETRRFDAATGKTYSMRSKEDADDYRYFPDPDLPPIELSEAYIERLRAALPLSPDALKGEFMRRYALSDYDAGQLTEDAELAKYFEAAAAAGGRPKQVANLIISDIFRLMPEGDAIEIPIPPKQIAELAALIDGGAISAGAAKAVIDIMWSGGGSPEDIIQREGYGQINERGALQQCVRDVIAANPQMAADYRAGKDKLINALIGKAMAETKGRGNPAIIREMMLEIINK